MNDVAGRILVADDEAPNRLYLTQILERQGWRVSVAEDGEEALRRAAEEDFDLVLVDVVMPGIDGFEVCARLKADARTADWPVIMVTARTAVEDVEESFVRGAFDYIRKPFNPRELVARVRNALALRASTAALRDWRQRVSRELRLANEVQRALFATPWTRAAHWEVRALYRPAAEVGGDFLDVTSLPDGRLAFAVGDVSGHGVAPALIAALLKATLADLCRDQPAVGPAVIAQKLEQRFCRHVTSPELYATLLLGIEDPDRGGWRFVSCGHPAPLLWRAGAALPVPAFSAHGLLPIGFGGAGDSPADPADAEVAIHLEPGDRLWCFTDGIIEAAATGGGELGEDGLRAILDGMDGGLHPPRALIETLERTGVRLGGDDITVLTLGAVPPPADRWHREIVPEREAVTAAARELEQWLRARGWCEEAAGAAELLALEQGMNVLDHATPPPGAPLDWMAEAADADAVALTLTDRGRPWTPPDTPAPVGDDAERGRGWWIIAALAAEREYLRTHGENIHRFLVRRTPRPDPGAAAP